MILHEEQSDLDTPTGAMRTYVCLLYTSMYPCPEAGEVELCTIDGGGHYWPGGDPWAGATVFCGSGQGALSDDIIANDAFWSWFVAHPMP